MEVRYCWLKGGQIASFGAPIVVKMSEELDQVRGVLAALANRGAPLLQPVFTSAVSAALRWRNRVLESGECLNLLSEVGDVQCLPGGLWLPCPTTLVRCAGLLVVVSGLPTSRLAGELGGQVPLTLGISRTVSANSIAEYDIRMRDFFSWCRAPVSSVVWAENLIANMQYRSGTVIEGMEWHDHWTPGIDRRWSEFRSDVELSRNVVLARFSGRSRVAVYFVLRRNGNRLEMADVPKSEGMHQRIRYALLAAAGNPAIYRSVPASDGIRDVSVPRILPSPEFMVLSALGNSLTPPDAWEQVFRIPESAWPQIEQMLAGLGLARSDAS